MAPAVSEVFFPQKKKYSFAGSYGSICFRIGDSQQKFLTVAWSIPYHTLFFANWVIVAITDKPMGRTAFRTLYRYLYKVESFCSWL